MAYNPLAKPNLAASVARALLSRDVERLPPTTFAGAGVYVLYYEGTNMPYEPYEPITTAGKESEDWIPIYVGKAIPKGGRVGGFGLDATVGNALSLRLEEHAVSIRQARNLDIRDFCCRYLILDDIWIPLAESILIEIFRPIWNTAAGGFGNHDPGSGRYQQRRSRWDVIHPGRPWADRLKPNTKTEEQIIEAIASTLKTRSGSAQEQLDKLLSQTRKQKSKSLKR